MMHREDLERLLQKHECGDFRWFDPKSMVVAEWVRMKCRFGCPHYGKAATCPPYVPSLAECRQFFAEYGDAALIHFAGSVQKPEDRHAWTRSINRRLLQLEREVFLAGCYKAFILFVDPCNLCDDCAGGPADCRMPQNARPAPEALGVDVFAVARSCGYQIQVLKDHSQQMNRFGMLMVQ